MCNNYSKYNYTFSLVHNKLVGDALSVGNETRYFNHSKEEANIDPRGMVNTYSII